MKRKPTHTPGPWTCVPGTLDFEYNVSQPDGMPLTMDPREHRANAALIGAAPDILAALESLISRPDADSLYRAADLKKARGAIKKARDA